MSFLLTLPIARATDANNGLYSGALLDAFLTGTTTRTPVYTTSALDTEHTNPVEANSAGLFPAIYLDPAITYRFRLRTSAGANITGMDFDPVTGGVVDLVVSTDFASLQEALDYIGENGGDLLIPPGSYALTGQVTLTPTALTNIRILGYGAEITTTGAISGFKISGAEFFPHQILVEGLKINHRGNSTATFGFELVHSSNVTLRNCTVEAHGTGASYAACVLEQSDTADADTGCLWCTIENFTVRPRSGGDGSITYGIRSIGYNNALRIIGGAISATTGVSLVTAGTAEFLSNAVAIDGVAFEGGTTAISVVGKTGAFASISGLRVINCRAESLTNFFSMSGSTVQPVVVPFLAGNYLTSDVTNYIVNTNSLRVFSLDSSANSPNAPETYFGGTWLMRNTTGSGATLDLESTGAGIAIQRWLSDVGGVLATMKWESGGIATLQGSGAGSLNHTGVRGISQTTTAAANLRGTATFAAGTTVAVSFGTAEADASYYVELTAQADPVGRLWVSGKGTGGFTINNSSSTSIAVDWLLVR